MPNEPENTTALVPHKPEPMQQIVSAAPNPFAFRTLAEVRDFAKDMADSGCFGIKKPSQAITLLKLCNDENWSLLQCLERFHVFEDGKLSQRADFTQGTFENTGGWILFHIRSDEMCAASFGLGAAPTKDAEERALKRFELQWQLEDPELEGKARTDVMLEVARNTKIHETTIIRTLEDAEDKGITQGRNGKKANWTTSPRQMLHARCITEGIKVIRPSSVPFASEDEVVDIIKAEHTEREAVRASLTEKEKLQWQLSDLLTKAESAENKEVKRDLLGRASEIRCELAEKYPEKAPKTPASVSGGMDTAPQPPNEAPAGKAEQDGLDLTPTEPLVEPPPGPNWKEYKIKCIKSNAYKGRLLMELTKEEIDVLWEKKGRPNLENADKAIRLEAKMLKLAWLAIHPEEAK